MKAQGAFDEPRAGDFCRDFLFNLRDVSGRQYKRLAESTSRGGIQGLVGAIVARSRPSRREMAVEGSVAGLVARVHAAFA